DVRRWCDSFIADLDEQRALETPRPHVVSVPPALMQTAAESTSLCLILDYDGTLVAHTAVPELAVPDEELMTLLSALAARVHTAIHLVSSRRHDDLERWFGECREERHQLLVG